MICRVCGAECADTAELCPVCGADLTVAAEETPAPAEETVLQHPVLAVSCDDVVNAEIFRDLLRENGIPFACDTAESGGSMKVVFGGGFLAEDIYVDEENLETAQALYDEVLASEPAFDDEAVDEDETDI